MSKNTQQKVERIFDLLYAGYGINIKELGDYFIIRLFQCADMHNPALSSR